MSKRTNWVAWGLVVALAAVLLVALGFAWTTVSSRQRVKEQLLQATLKGDTALVQRLLTEAPGRDAQEEALIAAASLGHGKIVQLLVDRGVNVNATSSDGTTALSEAAGHLNEQVEIVKLLLAKGAAVNNRDRRGWTPLHYAAERVHPAVVRLLIEAGAEVNAKNNDSETPLARALQVLKVASYKRVPYQRKQYPLAVETVRLLREAGARP